MTHFFCVYTSFRDVNESSRAIRLGEPRLNFFGLECKLFGLQIVQVRLAKSLLTK